MWPLAFAGYRAALYLEKTPLQMAAILLRVWQGAGRFALCFKQDGLAECAGLSESQ